MIKFRPYFAFIHFMYDDNQQVVQRLEKCYLDTPDTWSEKASRAFAESKR